MTRAYYYSEQCPIATEILYTTLDSGKIRVEIKTECKQVQAALDTNVVEVDPLLEIFTNDGQLAAIADRLPHRAFIFLGVALKGLQIEANLFTPLNISVEITKTNP